MEMELNILVKRSLMRYDSSSTSMGVVYPGEKMSSFTPTVVLIA
jgi:hypothetical protein